MEYMNQKQLYPILQVLLAAALFGAATPLSKIILLSEVDPIPLAAFLYLGSGFGALIFMGTQYIRHDGQSVEAQVTATDVPWLLGGIIAGGVAAPIILLIGLEQTPASTASLLLNFEGVSTALIAVFFFKEAVDKSIGWAIGLITLASFLLSWNGNNEWGFSLGAFGIIAACLLWGLDNNFTRHISAKDPLMIVAVKGFGAGLFSLLLSFILKKPLPSLNIILWSMLLGFISYGLSIQLFILSMRDLGAARTSVLFGTAPFVGMLLSIVLLREIPQVLFWVAFPVMVAGTWLMLTENHAHPHTHEPGKHVHRHAHPEGHHEHAHPDNIPLANGSHSHWHSHEVIQHLHTHMPDIHHRHGHEKIPEV